MKFQDTSIHRSKVKKKVVRTQGHTDKPKAICPTNFFKVGGIKNSGGGGGGGGGQHIIGKK